MSAENENKQKHELPPVLALAYLGDAFHSLWVRKRLVESGITLPGKLNEAAAAYVTAEAQAAAFRRIEGLLTEAEADLCRRAKNNRHLNGPRRASHADYREATAFEALLGMLSFGKDEERAYRLLESAYTAES